MAEELELSAVGCQSPVASSVEVCPVKASLARAAKDERVRLTTARKCYDPGSESRIAHLQPAEVGGIPQDVVDY